MGEDRDATRMLEGDAELGAGRRRVATAGWNGGKYEVVLRRCRRVRRAQGGHILEQRAAACVDHTERVGTGGVRAEVRSRHVEVAVPGVVPRLVATPDWHDRRDRAAPGVHEDRPTASRYHHMTVRCERRIIDAERAPGRGGGGDGDRDPERCAVDVVLM